MANQPINCRQKISSQFVCGFSGACLDCMVSGVQATTELEVFMCSWYLGDSEDYDSLP